MAAGGEVLKVWAADGVALKRQALLVVKAQAPPLVPRLLAPSPTSASLEL
jgi:hypothetical protein